MDDKEAGELLIKIVKNTDWSKVVKEIAWNEIVNDSRVQGWLKTDGNEQRLREMFEEEWKSK